MKTYTRELAIALKAAKEAGTVQFARAKKVLRVELKADASPVTEVDRKCENLIRRGLLSVFPRDGFYGEESSRITGKSNRQWIVDPLDGTRPYLRGIPTYSVLIALEEEGDPVIGVIHLPAMAITCWASRGGGAFCNGTTIRVSMVSSLSGAIGTAFGFVEKAGQPLAGQLQGKRLLKLMRSWNYSYGFMDAYSYVCVASGKLDIAVNLLDKPWDCAAAACIVREAGGTFSDIKGRPTVHGGSIILSNGRLHNSALRYFK